MSIIGNFLNKRGFNPDGRMNFMEHIEEFRWHLIRSLIAVVVCSIIAYINIDFIFEKIILAPADQNFISYQWLCAMGKFLHISALCLPPLDIKFQSTQLDSQFMMSFSTSFMIGFIISFPYIFWEFWKFIRPALKKNELKYARGIVFWSSLLFFIGVLFAYFLIAPFSINFFTNYQLSPKFHNIFTIGSYYSTLSNFILGLGIVFELPVIVYFLTKMGIITTKVLKNIRRYAYVAIMIVAAVITPPDWFSMFLVAIPLFVLYEASIVVCNRVNRKREAEKLDW